MSTTFSLVVYVKPPHARPTSPSTIRITPNVLFMAPPSLAVAGSDVAIVLTPSCRDRPSGATSMRIGVSGQVNLPPSATCANENIPTPHHRAETILEEQSLGSSCHTSSGFSALQIGGQSRMYAKTR